MKIHESRTIKGKKYRRLSKLSAKREYYKGTTIYMLPNKLNPENKFVGFISIRKRDNDTFEQKCTRVEYYNCNHEAGYYLSYYIRL